MVQLLHATVLRGSFAEFWRLWNPEYGYFLYDDVYKPLIRLMARPAAKMMTFLFCGLMLHDIS